MSDSRVIKKYPNRRLYDTAESRYITLADVRKLVVENVDFVVVDKKTQEDITRSILLQVIAEQEHMSEPLLSRDFLSQVIRSYGGVVQTVIGTYLEQSIRLFAREHRELRERVKGMSDAEMLQIAASLATRNFDQWRAMQNEILKMLSDTGRANRESAADKPAEYAGPSA